MAPHDLPPPPSWTIPNFVLKVEDLSHPGVSIFFDCVRPKEALTLAVEASYAWLYTPITAPTQWVLRVLNPLIHYECVVNHHSQASRPSHSFSDRSMAWHTHQARMRRKRSISPSIGSNHQRLVHKMKYWACWFTRLCIVISTMQKIHVQGVLSRVLQVRTFWYRLLSLNFVFRTTGRFREASRWVCTTALET